MSSITHLLFFLTMLVTVMAICDPKKRETGILNLTEEQQEDLYCDNTIVLLVEKSDPKKREYRAIQTVSIDQPIQPQEDFCWVLFNLYLTIHKPLFQIWANKYCRDYRSCWCCPTGGLCVAFAVKPTSPPCWKWSTPVYQKILAVFEG